MQINLKEPTENFEVLCKLDYYIKTLEEREIDLSKAFQENQDNLEKEIELCEKEIASLHALKEYMVNKDNDDNAGVDHIKKRRERAIQGAEAVKVFSEIFLARLKRQEGDDNA